MPGIAIGNVIRGGNGITVLPTGEISAEGTDAALAPNWYIDQAAGSDANAGTSEDAPLASFDEWRSRVGDATLTVTTTVWFLSDYTGNLVVDKKIGLYPGLLILRGRRTPLYSSVLSGRVAWDPAARVEGTITDAALPVSWTASGLVGKLLQFDDRAAGFFGERPWSWVAKDNGARTARFGPPWDGNAGATFTPTVGERFTVCELTKIHGSIYTDSGNYGGAGVIGFDLQIEQPGGFVPSVSLEGGLSALQSCKLVGEINAWGSQSASLYGCLCDGDVTSWHGSNLFVIACTIDGEFSTRECSYARIMQSTLMQNGRLTVRAMSVLRMIEPEAWLAIFDHVAGVIIQNGGLIEAQTHLWGKNITNDRLAIVSNGALVYSVGSFPVFDGAGAEIRMGATLTTFAAVEAAGGMIDAPTLARIVRNTV
jgi:hypothetical protein